MPKICYQQKNFGSRTLDLIGKCDEIVNEYATQGYELTVRQLYYQLVSRDIIANKQTEYKRLVGIVNDARLAGLLDWSRIVDLTRELRGLSHWTHPESIIHSAASSYRIDKWSTQKHRVEVWVEKDALRNVVERACNALDVPFFVCRGYTSQSEMWGAAQRLAGYRNSISKKQTPVIIHLGDHDPSGVDMTRDIRDRLALFGTLIEIRRVALNMDQVEQYNPPPNPAKATDARFTDYVAAHGDECWELDALNPQTLSGIIEREVSHFIDGDAWQAAEREERGDRDTLLTIAGRYDDVAEFVKGGTQ